MKWVYFCGHCMQCLFIAHDELTSCKVIKPYILSLALASKPILGILFKNVQYMYARKRLVWYDYT